MNNRKNQRKNLEILTHRITITGVVQGVGFRPYIYNLANNYRLKGFVRNNTKGVIIGVQGDTENIKAFEERIKENPPPKSRIDTFTIDEYGLDLLESFKSFSIVESEDRDEKTAQISADLDVCNDCLKELLDKKDRRYFYPFINCTNCGPRFTIIEDVPYDRPMTTMGNFTMCKDCQEEYSDPTNRRFHAQPNACHVCGPKVTLYNSNAREILSGGSSNRSKEIFKTVSELLKQGKILAIKGIGGFHLACDATDEEAVSTLRNRKYREDKPFAVMFPNIESIKSFCEVNSEEEILLKSYHRPIVLLKKLKNKDVAPSVAPNNHYLGAMLPYSPIHYLIFYYFEKPLVMTSGNVSDEPIVFKNSDAFERLYKIADYFLVHNRDIYLRCDDSVYRVWQGMEYPIRRSRGYVPNSINSGWKFDEPVLACGPEQKNTFALAKGNRIYLSHHIGDMDNYNVLKSFEEGVTHFRNIFDIEPKIIAYDLHPDYLSTKFALNYTGENVKKVGVQHHHAHAVSCMVENDISHPVIAITLDGTGYGVDETIWGGEILISEYDNFRRIGHLAYIEMPGGTAAIENPWQMGLSYLYRIYKNDVSNLGLPFLDSVDETKKLLVLNSIESGLNSPLTSSCGRLFDGIAAIAGVRNRVNYEGQAAVEFEQFIDDKSAIAYDFDLLKKDGKFIIQWEAMVEQVVSDVMSKKSVSEIALKFHNGLVNILLSVSEKVRNTTGINDVVLSGGVFMNIYLLSQLYDKLSKRGFSVYTHRLAPTNDGGIALGQAVIASAKIKNGR